MELKDIIETAIEIAKLFASLLTPVAIVCVGFLIKRTLAQQERRWELQERLADKRVYIYEKVAEDLNRIYCYVMDVGTFKAEDLEAIIKAKRNVDTYMHAYQAIWPEETFRRFIEFMDSAFEKRQGSGKDAKIRTWSLQKKKAYDEMHKTWIEAWKSRFTEERDPQHESKYKELMRIISRDLMYPDNDVAGKTSG